MSEIDDAIAKKLERLTTLVGSDKAQEIVNQDIKRKENEGNLVAGAKIGFRNLGLGTEQFIRGLVPGVSEREKNLQNIINENAIKDKQVLSTGYGTAGNIGATVLPALATAAIPGVNTVTGMAATGALLGAAQPTTSQDETLGTEDQSRLINTGIGAGGGVIGKIGGDKIAKVLQNRIATSGGKLNKLKLQNQVKDQTIKTASENGYVLPPSQINPSTTQKIVEGVGGKIQTAQSASLKNQKVTNKLTNKALGLDEDTVITQKVLEEIRSEAGQVYDDIAKVGTIYKDDVFVNNLKTTFDDYTDMIIEFPDRKIPAIDNLIKNLNSENFDSKNLVRVIKMLNRENKTLYKGASQGDTIKELQAGIQGNVVDDLLNLIGRNLDDIEGVDKALIETFNKNKIIIAKTHAVGNALDDSTSNIVAGKLAKNKFLTDELKIIADTFNLSPKSLQKINQSMSVSAADTLMSAGMLAATGNPAVVGYMAARPAARAGMLSSAYQKMIQPKYNTNNILNKLGLLANKTTPAVSIGAGATQQNRGLLE